MTRFRPGRPIASHDPPLLLPVAGVPETHLRRAAPGLRRAARAHHLPARQAREAIGYALGGEARARLTQSLAMATSPDTLLRRVKQLKDGSPPVPRFVGIDDWAWCKGQRY